MARTCCCNGHTMWSGDGKPVVWAFRLKYFKDYQSRKPEKIILWNEGPLTMIYDCYDDDENDWEELDCWFCDECQSLAVFYYSKNGVEDRADYIPAAISEEDTAENYDDWEEYLAFRDWEFEDFCDSCQGKRPYDALLSAEVLYRYRVSPDKKTIMAVKNDGSVGFKYVQVKNDVTRS